MSTIDDLFSPSNIARTDCVTASPKLAPHARTYPGMSPEESAQSALAGSDEYLDVIAKTFFIQDSKNMTSAQLKSHLPPEWTEALGRFAHALLSPREAEVRGIKVTHVAHDGGGFHWSYSPLNQEAA